MIALFCSLLYIWKTQIVLFCLEVTMTLLFSAIESIGSFGFILGANLKSIELKLETKSRYSSGIIGILKSF